MAVKAIHILWIQGIDHLRANFPLSAENLRLWGVMFPSWKLTVWDDDAIRDALRTVDATLGVNLLPAYDAASSFAFKGDIGRVAIVFLHGGMYVDTDVECIRPFAHILHPDKPTAMFRVILDNVEKQHMFNSNNCFFYAPRPRCEALRDMLLGMAEKPLPRSTQEVLSFAGPLAFCSAFQRHDTHWLPAEMFEPVQFSTMNMYGLRGDAARAAFPFAVTVHTFAMSWVSKATRDITLPLARVAAAAVQQRSANFIALMVTLLVLVPLCVAFIVLWALARRDCLLLHSTPRSA